MSAILKSDENGVLHLPANLLPSGGPNTAYIVDLQNGAALVQPKDAAPSTKDPKDLPPKERAAEFLKWVETLPPGVGLSDWAVSRDSIYD